VSAGLLDQMRDGYSQGTLVPFLGSGMSAGVCCLWPDLVGRIEQIASSEPVTDRPGGSESDDFELTRRASRALERLRMASGHDGVVAAVRRALMLEGDSAEPPPSTRKLASLYWPLVLTTNYDDLYIGAVHERLLGSRVARRGRTSEIERRTPPVQVVGRSPSDCHRVLSALREPVGPLLWTLQGFLPGQASIKTPDSGEARERWIDYVSAVAGTLEFSMDELERQLVVGHAEYRAVAVRSESFRRAFADVYRSRSLLFLGSGLRDRYLLDLFGQIIELYGPSSHQHYAVVKRGEGLDAAFMRRHFGVWVLEFDDYLEIPGLLAGLESSKAARTGVCRWDYVDHSRNLDSSPSLSVVSKRLEAQFAGQGCLVVSGGGSEDWPRLNDGIRDLLVDVGLLPERAKTFSKAEVGRLFHKPEGRDFTWVLREDVDAGPDHLPLLLVARARLEPTSWPGRKLRPLADVRAEPGSRDAAGRRWRDLRIVKPAMQEVLEVAAESGRRRVVSTLLATGSLRSFPPSFALQELARAWASQTHTCVSLEIYLDNDEVGTLTDLRSGRLDLGYVLSRSASGRPVASSVRLWVEVVEKGERVERFLERRDAESSIRTLLEDHWLAGPRWRLDVWPQPCLEWRPWTFEDITDWEDETGESMSLEQFGVFNGSTLQAGEVEAQQVV
jgi:hypothetical protein